MRLDLNSGYAIRTQILNYGGVIILVVTVSVDNNM